MFKILKEESGINYDITDLTTLLQTKGIIQEGDDFSLYDNKIDTTLTLGNLLEPVPTNHWDLSFVDLSSSPLTVPNSATKPLTPLFTITLNATWFPTWSSPIERVNHIVRLLVGFTNTDGSNRNISYEINVRRNDSVILTTSGINATINANNSRVLDVASLCKTFSTYEYEPAAGDVLEVNPWCNGSAAVQVSRYNPAIYATTLYVENNVEIPVSDLGADIASDAPTGFTQASNVLGVIKVENSTSDTARTGTAFSANMSHITTTITKLAHITSENSLYGIISQAQMLNPQNYLGSNKAAGTFELLYTWNYVSKLRYRKWYLKRSGDTAIVAK